MTAGPRWPIVSSLLFVGLALTLAPTFRSLAFDPDATWSARRPLYDNEVEFEKLSGAAQNLFRLKYGPKATFGSESTASQGTDADALYPIEPFPATSDILVNDPGADTSAQDTQSETTLVLAGNNVIVSFNDSGSYSRNKHFTGYSQSTDGGASFTDRGGLPDNSEGDAGDPVLARDDTTGTIYLATLGFTTGENIQVFRSFDNGTTFSSPVNATPGFAGTVDFQDKEWLAVDNFPGSGLGNLYLAWRRFPLSGGDIRLTRSTDGGATWGPDQGVVIASGASANVQGAYATVGADHAVYVFWFDQNTPMAIRLRKSTDQALSFAPPVMVAPLRTTSTNGNLRLNGGFRTNSFPQAVTCPTNASFLYVAFNDQDPSPTDKANVYLTRSTDGGETWQAPVRVNDDVGTNDQWQPALAITPECSRLFLGWYDRRQDPANSLIETWGVIGAIDAATGAITFGQNFPISTTSFPVVIGQDPVINTTYMGDYDQAVSDGSSFYYTWGDNRSANSFHANQPDVRLAKISVPGLAPGITTPAPGSTLTTSAVTFWGGHVDGDLEHRLSVGKTPGGTDLFDQDLGTGHTATVSGLPQSGGIWVRYWTRFAGSWQFRDYTYTMEVEVPPPITTPAPGSTLTTSTVTFTGGHDSRELANTVQHWLSVGTMPGGKDLFDDAIWDGHMVTVSGLPTISTIYVRYATRFEGGWKFRDYTYDMKVAPRISGFSPTSGPRGTKVTITGTEFTGATAVQFNGLPYPYWVNASFTVLSPTSIEATVPAGADTGHIDVITPGGSATSRTPFTVTAQCIIKPAPGSTLTTSRVTFTGGHVGEDLQHRLSVGTTLGGTNLFNQDLGTGHTATVSGLPTKGKIFVRYATRYTEGWEFCDSAYIMDVQMPLPTPVPPVE